MKTPHVTGEAQQIERTLAVARAFLAVSSLIAIVLDPTRPGGFAALTITLMVIFVIHSLLILALVRIRSESTPAFRFIVHAIDILWPAVISIFTTGPNSPFFVVNVFVLLAAAYRWGFQETLATSGAAILLFFFQVILVGSVDPSFQSILVGRFELNNFIMRGLYLLITGYLLGYLGEEEKQLRTEMTGIARIISKAQAEVGLRGALRAVLGDILQVFGSRHAILALEEMATGKAYLWEVRMDPGSPEIDLILTEVPSSDKPTYLFKPPGHAWHAFRERKERGIGVLDLYALDESGHKLPDAPWVPPRAFEALYDFRHILAVTMNFGNDWSGQLCLLNPSASSSREAAVRYLQTISKQVSPAIYSVFLVRRLRARAGALERARVARELHDGVIQSLIGLEMQVDVLRRQPAASQGHMADELARIQELLREEVINLRELMQQMRPINLGPKQLLDYLASTVDRFRRDTGIAARFVTPLEEVSIPSRVCNEVARIVQEALVNVRKHSGARNVMVRFDSQNGDWRLVIDDDGRGFDFAGRLNHNELENSRKGPLVIKERVRSIGGELAIESGSGRGARLEIIFPQKAYG
ncbi:MAG: sensor histidine kinase [Terriglobia bacterium]